MMTLRATPEQVDRIVQHGAGIEHIYTCPTHTVVYDRYIEAFIRYVYKP